ncbi:hypothetical protein CBS101457_006885 [Exobasidium rhododendri]|nr:hypothetical protein CBS101457_006885 [Exobasidium rhododendri]
MDLPSRSSSGKAPREYRYHEDLSYEPAASYHLTSDEGSAAEYDSPRRRTKETKKGRAQRSEKEKERFRLWQQAHRERKSRLGLGRAEPYKPHQVKRRTPPGWDEMSKWERNVQRKEWLELGNRDIVPEEYKSVPAIILQKAFEIRHDPRNKGKGISFDDSLSMAESREALADDAFVEKNSEFSHQPAQRSSARLSSGKGKGKHRTDEDQDTSGTSSRRHGVLGFEIVTRPRTPTSIISHTIRPSNRDPFYGYGGHGGHNAVEGYNYSGYSDTPRPQIPASEWSGDTVHHGLQGLNLGYDAGQDYASSNQQGNAAHEGNPYYPYY